MSQTDPAPSDAAESCPACSTYWTPGKVLLGAVMCVAALGVVLVVQWDDVTRIADSFSERSVTDGVHRPGRPVSLLEEFDLDGLQLPKEKLLPGGPPKDGIPALTDPEAVPVADADFMRPEDRVVGVTIAGVSRAYPIKVLNWHECYNDTLNGVPIAVVFCPLCDSVTVVDRRLNGVTYEFGISGLLCNSNVLLYDRRDDGLWSQAGLIAVSGPNAGKSLTHLHDWSITTFNAWRGAHRESTVASVDTGHYSVEHYNRVAYASYFMTDDLMFPAEPSDDRFPNKYRVVGLQVGQTAKAYPVDRIAASPDGRIHDTIGGQALVLEAVGSPPSVRIVEAPDGAQVIHTFWFAWYAFHPQTQVYGPGNAE